MNKTLTRLIAILGLLALVCAGCGEKQDSTTAKKESKGKVEISYVEWSSTVASSHVVKAVLEDKLGYDVELTPVGAAAMWQAVAVGDVDGHICAWLPTTHEHYYKAMGPKMEDLGVNLTGTRIGLVVPSYVTIDSIDQIRDHAKKFDNKIIGIDPGAGIMSKTEKVITDYGMDNIELMEGSDATMCAAMGDAIKNKEWIAVTGWTPHWMFARWDLKYLEDPKNIYGGEETIRTMVRKGLKDDKPEVYAYHDKFNWTPDDMQEVMVLNMADGADPEKVARQWVKDHEAKVSSWLP